MLWMSASLLFLRDHSRTRSYPRLGSLPCRRRSAWPASWPKRKDCGREHNSEILDTVIRLDERRVSSVQVCIVCKS